MPVELTPEQKEKARVLAKEGCCGTNIARELHVPPLRVFPFLKREQIYKDGRKKSNPNYTSLRKSLYLHQGLPCTTLARKMHFKARECVRQYLIREKLFDRWWADRQRRKEQEKNVAFTRRHLDEIVGHLSVLEHSMIAQKTGDAYIWEVLEKDITMNDNAKRIRYEDISEVAELLKAYDFYVLVHDTAPRYARIAAVAPSIPYTRGLKYLERAGRKLLKFTRRKKEKKVQMQSLVGNQTSFENSPEKSQMIA